MAEKAEEAKALKRAKRMKVLKVVGLIVLVGYMVMTLQMLSSLKALDSKLGENGRLLDQAIVKETSMGEKGSNVQVMANSFSGVVDKLAQAQEGAGQIASLANTIKTKNEALLSANQGINQVAINNIGLVTAITGQMSTIVDYMAQVGVLLGSVKTGAAGQLDTIKAMYELAVYNNGSMPALP